MTDNLAGNNIYNNTPYGNLGYDNTANVYRYAEDNSAIIRKEGYDVKSLSEEIRNLYLR